MRCSKETSSWFSTEIIIDALFKIKAYKSVAIFINKMPTMVDIYKSQTRNSSQSMETFPKQKA